MKILLINPKPKIWIKSTTIPLGLAYIASVLKKNHYDVRILDLNIYPDAQIPHADIYGMTATTPVVKNAYRLAAKIKTSSNHIVFGGPHPTCLPDEAMEQNGVDFVIRGEGEYSFLELVKRIEDGSDHFESISGLSYKKEGKTIHNSSGDYLKNLDELPYPAFELFGSLKKYSHPQPLIGWRKPVVNIITSRGCPFNCHFCYKGTFGRSWRPRSPENIAGEWEMLIKKFKVKELGIQDDCFNLDISRAKDFARLIIRKGLQIPFTFPNGIRADLIDEEMVVLLKKAGMYRTAVGVESGNQMVLDYIDKKLTLDKVMTGMKLLKKHGIQTICFFVVGNPVDNKETLQDTIEFAKKINPTFAQFSMATPFPGTRLYEQIKDYDSFRIKDWDDYSQFDQKGYFDYPHMTGEEIHRFVKKSYRDFYIRPSQIFRLMTIKDFYFKIPDYVSGFIHFMIKGS